ncbi:MAG: phosphatidylglycerophosphatase A [Sulfurifustis sp.]
MIQQQAHWGHRIATWIAMGFGVGRVPVAPGTFGTLVGIPFYFLLRLLPVSVYLLTVVVLFLLGVWICRIAETHLGQRDHGGIVWDEVVGFLIAMFLAPPGWAWIVVGFLLFRVFDVWKPLPIRRFEHLPGGLGVMADDAIAGIYACVVLQALARFGAYEY